MKQPQFHRVGLFAKVDEPAAATLARDVLDLLAAAHCEVFVDERISSFASGAEPLTPVELAARAELLIVIGGDGSLLAAARAVDWAQVPLLGINLGRLGFLADVRPESLDSELDAVLHGRGTLERRLMLHAQTFGAESRSEHAINDVVIKRLDGSRLLELEYWAGDIFVSRIRADGLIVASPTGSTAYALSAGGPIIAPQLADFVIVPICPHGLGERPLVVAAGDSVRIRPMLAPVESAEIVLDGQMTLQMTPGDEVLVSRSDRELLLLHPPGYEYFATLREKLGWGGRKSEC